MSTLERWRKTSAQALVPMACVTALILAIGALDNAPLTSVAISMLVNLTLVVGTYVFSGNSGVVSFGQLSFMMIGAYTTALVTIPANLKKILLPNLAPWLRDVQVDYVAGVLIAAAVSAAIAFVVGLPLSRLTGLGAGIASLALLLIVQTVFSQWDDVTMGAQTMIGIPTGLSLWPALGLALLAIVAAFAYQRSRAGLRMCAAREDELAAIAMGVDVARERHLAFTLSGAVCGMGGGMMAGYLGALNSTLSSFLTPTFLTVAMLVIGGLYSLWGAVTGTLFVTVVVEILRRFEEGVDVFGIQILAPAGLDQVVLGIILLLTLYLRPDGITRSSEARWPRFRRPESTVPDPVASVDVPVSEPVSAGRGD
ncbi:MAG: branched-chain amino acid ABC transporter permease [Microbacterium sp.]